MDLKYKFAIGWDAFGHSVRKRHGTCARHIANKESTFGTQVAIIAPFFANEDQDMVYYGRVARNNFHAVNPSVLSQVRVRYEVLIFDFATCGYVKRCFSHRDDQIRLARQLPARYEFHRCRFMACVAASCTGSSPILDRGDFLGGHATVVLKRTVGWACVPGGHATFVDNFDDHVGPGRRIVIIA